jgi:hypothetical protein
MEDVLIVKELGRGMFGTSFLVRFKKKTYALKRQTVLQENTHQSTSHALWREFDFYKWISTLQQKDKQFFMELFSYKFYKCDFLYVPIQTPRSIETRRLVKKLKSSPYCSDFLLDYKDGILEDLMFSTKLTRVQCYSIVIQCLYALYLMHNAKYMHRDCHTQNIGYKKIPKTSKIKLTIEGKNYTIPSGGYQISLIDYGMILNKSFKMTKDEKEKYLLEHIRNYDLFIIIDTLMLKNLSFSKSRINSGDMINKLYEDNLKKFDECGFMFWSIWPLDMWKKEKVLKSKIPRSFLDTIYADEMSQILEILDKPTWCKYSKTKYEPNFIDDKDILFIKEHSMNLAECLLHLKNAI